jgi:hypothetical protein
MPRIYRHPRREGIKPRAKISTNNTMKLPRIIHIAALFSIAPILNACAVRINADGSKDATIDAPSAIRIIEIIEGK